MITGIFKTMRVFYLFAGVMQLSVVCLNGQITATTYSPPLGGIELSAGAFRETPVGIPLHRAAVMIADLVEVSPPVVDDEDNFESVRLFLDRVVGAPGEYNPDPDSGLPTYYLEVVTGAAAGERFPIAGSGEDWVILEKAPQGSLAADFDPNKTRDRVRIRPCWTPHTLMSAADTPLSEQLEYADQRETRDGDVIILLGREVNSQHVLQRFNDSVNTVQYWAEWDGMDNRLIANDYGVLPGQVIWIRRANAGEVKWVVTGDVTTFNTTWSVPLPPSDEVLEWSFSLTEPKATTLDSSGLESVFRTSASAAERTDELLVWEDTTGFYPRPAKRFYLQSASPEPIWRELGDELADQGTYTLEPAKAYTIRRRGE
jgi:uncharacterized protein (TIGR02597 family)